MAQLFTQKNTLWDFFEIKKKENLQEISKQITDNRQVPT